MKFKKIQLAKTINPVSNKTINRLTKDKLKEAAKDLNVLQNHGSFLKIRLSEQKPSNIAKCNVPRRSNPRRSFQNRKIITSTPHFTKANKSNVRFSNAGSSILSPISIQNSLEAVKEIQQPPALQKDNEDSDSEVDQPKLKNRKRINSDPVQSPDKKRELVDGPSSNKKRELVDKLDGSSDIVFVDNKNDAGSQRVPSTTKTKSKKQNRKQKNMTKIKISPVKKPLKEPDPSSPVNVLSPPRDRTEFVNKTPRSGRTVDFVKFNEDPDIDVFTKGLDLVPSSPQAQNSPKSPSPKKLLRSSRVITETAQTEIDEAGPSGLQEKKSPNVAHPKTPESKNNKSKDAKASKSSLKKGKAEKAAKVQSGDSSPKFNLIEDIILRKATLSAKKQQEPLENAVSTNNEITDKIAKSPPKISQKVNKNLGKTIQEIIARRLTEQVQAPPRPMDRTESGHDDVPDTALKPNSDNEGNKSDRPDVLKRSKEKSTNTSAGPSIDHWLRSQDQRNKKRMSTWKGTCDVLDSFVESVEQRGEGDIVHFDSNSDRSKESELCFGKIKSAKKLKSNNEKVTDLQNTLEKVRRIKKNGKPIDRQIQTGRLSAPVFRRSAVLRSKSKISINLSDSSNDTPNIYDSLEEGNEIDALGFSNFNEPTLSFQHKPFRCDTPSRSISHLSWPSCNIQLPNASSASEYLHITENDLSPKHDTQVIRKYHNTRTNNTVKSSNNGNSKLVEQNMSSSLDLSLSNDANENSYSRPTTRSLRDRNSTNTSAKRKLNFKPKEKALSVDRETQAKANASRKRLNKSLEKNSVQQTHFDILLQAPKFNKKSHVEQSVNNKSLEKSSRSKHPPQFSRLDINDTTSAKSPQQTKVRRKHQQQDSILELHDISKTKKQSKKSSSKPSKDIVQPTEGRRKQHQQDPTLNLVCVIEPCNEIQDISKSKKKSNSKQTPRNQPAKSFQSLQADSSNPNEVPEEQQNKSVSKQSSQIDISNNLSNNQDMINVVSENPRTSMQPETPKQPLQNSIVDRSSVITDNEVPEYSRTRSRSRKQHKKSETKQQDDVGNNSRPNGLIDARSEIMQNKSGLKQKKLPLKSPQPAQRLRSTSRSKVYKENELVEDEIQSSTINNNEATQNSILESAQSTQGRSNDIQSSNNNNDENASVATKELSRNSTLKPGVETTLNSESFRKPEKENQAPDDENQSRVATSSTRGRKPNKNKANASKASKGRGKKSRADSLQCEDALILPDEGSRRPQRNCKPATYCYKKAIDISNWSDSFVLSPGSLKKLRHMPTTKRSQNTKALRMSNKMGKKLSFQTRIEEPSPAEPQDNHKNVSDSTLMPPPKTTFLRITNQKDSAADSGFDMSNSVQKKASTKPSKGRGGKKSTKATKTVEQVPEPSYTIEPPTSEQTTTEATCSTSSNNQPEMNGSDNENIEIEKDCLCQVVNGKIHKRKFVCSRPNFTNCASFGNLFVNEITKDPHNRYTIGYIRLAQGETKETSSSKKFDFVYVVVTGVAEVILENQKHVVHPGGFFNVPLDKMYSIKNISSDSYLEIHFTRLNQELFD